MAIRRGFVQVCISATQGISVCISAIAFVISGCLTNSSRGFYKFPMKRISYFKIQVFLELNTKNILNLKYTSITFCNAIICNTYYNNFCINIYVTIKNSRECKSMSLMLNKSYLSIMELWLLDARVLIQGGCFFSPTVYLSSLQRYPPRPSSCPGPRPRPSVNWPGGLEKVAGDGRVYFVFSSVKELGFAYKKCALISNFCSADLSKFPTLVSGFLKYPPGSTPCLQVFQDFLPKSNIFYGNILKNVFFLF